MSAFPFLSTSQWLRALRVLLGLYMVAHGATRAAVGTVDDFGGFFASRGIPAGVILAWIITGVEIFGGLSLATGRFVVAIAAWFAAEHVMGALLVHAPRGWFTVGHQSGGAEYSVLLVCCFLLIAANARATSTHDSPAR